MFKTCLTRSIDHARIFARACASYAGGRDPGGAVCRLLLGNDMKYQIFAEIGGRQWPLLGFVCREGELLGAFARASRLTGIDTDFLVAHPIKRCAK